MASMLVAPGGTVCTSRYVWLKFGCEISSVSSRTTLGFDARMSSLVSDIAPQLSERALESLECLGLTLADALARDAHVVTDLAQRVVAPKSSLDDTSIPLVERIHSRLYLLGKVGTLCLRFRVRAGAQHVDPLRLWVGRVEWHVQRKRVVWEPLSALASRILNVHRDAHGPALIHD